MDDIERRARTADVELEKLAVIEERNSQIEKISKAHQKTTEEKIKSFFQQIAEFEHFLEDKDTNFKENVQVIDSFRDELSRLNEQQQKT